jgi:hypothetical protein
LDLNLRHGAEFIDENGGGPGVRLHKSQRPKHSKQKATVRVALEREEISYISAWPRRQDDCIQYNS